ncbi:hypothetical protein GCM10009754_38040 [Amycolatopsis minnesotensis]|uniref:Fibronectin type-III domain-containing protein n=1 Tax=Amycolatopsis minnesotensis TaxID=337894 RepID=A0ABP5CF85_9PSEU
MVLACAAAVVAAVTGAAKPLPGLQFLTSGHWVYNTLLQAAFHVDGGTANIDAQAQVPGDEGSQVVQGDTSGYVVGRSRITQFGKSNLTVEQTNAPPSDEIPLGVEAAGGPYLVYRQAGRIVRLGDPPATVDAGDPVGDPVVTADGTMWLFRPTTGLMCRLPKDADRISSCPAAIPKGHAGGLTLVADRPQFVDTTTGTLNRLGDKGVEATSPLGVAVSAAARPASADVAGRIAILDPPARHLLLVDAATPQRAPITVALPDGDYDGPVSSGSVVALVDKKSNTLLTYDGEGRQADAKPIPRESGPSRLTKGEDSRMYLEGPEGTHVLVVGHDGKVADVPVVAREPGPVPAPGESGDSAKPPVAPPDRGQQRTAPNAGPNPPAREQEKPKPPVERKPDPPDIPASPPGAPTGVTAKAGSGSIRVGWGAAPDNRGPITAYHLSWPGGSMTVGGGARSATVGSLANGTRYAVTVTATNKAGTGPGASSPGVTPFAAASAPGGVTAKNANGTATVTWNPPALNGGALAHYEVSATGQGTKNVTGTTATFAGLATGSYTFTVRAVTTVDGQQVTGAPGSASLTIQKPTIALSRGGATSSAKCKAPACHWFHVVVKGFPPNTKLSVMPHSDNGDFSEPSDIQIDADGNGMLDGDGIRYDVPGVHVWVTISTPSGTITSNHFLWPEG